MNFADYWKGLDKGQKSDFATKVESTTGTLKQIAGGFRQPGEGLAIRIERESRRAVTVETMRPDVDWAFIRASHPAVEQAA